MSFRSYREVYSYSEPEPRLERVWGAPFLAFYVVSLLGYPVYWAWLRANYIYAVRLISRGRAVPPGVARRALRYIPPLIWAVHHHVRAILRGQRVGDIPCAQLPYRLYDIPSVMFFSALRDRFDCRFGEADMGMIIRMTRGASYDVRMMDRIMGIYMTRERGAPLALAVMFLGCKLMYAYTYEISSVQAAILCAIGLDPLHHMTVLDWSEVEADGDDVAEFVTRLSLTKYPDDLVARRRFLSRAFLLLESYLSGPCVCIGRAARRLCYCVGYPYVKHIRQCRSVRAVGSRGLANAVNYGFNIAFRERVADVGAPRTHDRVLGTALTTVVCAFLGPKARRVIVGVSRSWFHSFYKHFSLRDRLLEHTVVEAMGYGLYVARGDVAERDYLPRGDCPETVAEAMDLEWYHRVGWSDRPVLTKY